MNAPRPTHLYVVLPAYNEQTSLARLIPELADTLTPLGIPFTICPVDDGSKDGTAALARLLTAQMPVRLLQHPQNRGYGAAVKTGATWVAKAGNETDAMIIMDADNTHSPIYIADLVKKLSAGSDVVTASYTQPGAAVIGVPFKRRLMSRGANALLRARFRYPGVLTYTNGFRAYRVAALQKALRRYGDRLVEETNFAGGTELFIKTLRCGATAAEIPFTLHYENRGGDSKINIPKTIGSYIRLLFR